MNTLLKIAASSLVLGMTLVATSPGSASFAATPSTAAKAERQAARLAERAGDRLKARDGVKAVTLAESAVALSPRNADHRAILGQAYLQAGRFASAATAFRDALILNPTHGRAALSLALAEIAQGRTDSAKDALAQARDFVPASDYGLALALAGERDAAVAILESAAREEGATPKTRQNLALAYALAGRWRDSYVTAAQDVPSMELPARMSKWAQFASPQAVPDQVASLLGVAPVIDPGQPQQLALAPIVREPVAVASAPAPQPVPAPIVEPIIVMAEPVVPALSAPAAILRKVDLPAAKPVPLVRVAPVRPKPQPRSGNYVVQLGAFSSAARVEAAWDRYSSRTHRLSGYAPARTTFRSMGNATFYRLSVGGFATRSDAWALCGQIKASGGQCFVRGSAGDAPMQFAARAATKPTRLASR